MSNESKNNNESKLNKAAIFGISTIGVLLGVLLCIFPWGTTKLKGVLFNIGQVCISISVGSLLLEWFGYVNYTRKRMCEVLSENEVLRVLSKKRKQDLKTAILNNLYMPNKDLGENNIVSAIDSEMDNILKDYYYKEYIMYVDISVEIIDENKYIKKTIRKIYCADTINGEKCKLGKLLEIQMNPVLDDKTLLLKELKINDERIEDIVIKRNDNTGEPRNHYDTIFYADTSKIIDKLEFSDSIKIDMTYETYTDINDKVFSNQVSRPCKHYCIHFNYTDKINLDLVGFGFMTSENTEKTRVVRTLNGHMLRFMSWILPGDGVMAAITIKE